jgi:DNA-binding MurR/RpiR family transcriptional regulator
MGILVNRLLVLLNGADSGSTYYHIALTILKNLRRLADMNINEVADMCAVSKSTISKFVRELGYNDYSDFRYAIGFEEKAYRTQGNFLADVIGYLQDHSVREYADVLAEALKENARMLDMESIRRLARDIMNYDNVIAVGLMFSETAAINLQSKLGRVGKYIQTNQNDRSQYEVVSHAGEDSLIIVFSESGTFLDRYEMINHDIGKSIFALTKAKVVMITANRQMEKDARISYIIKMSKPDSVHAHRIIYPLVTDVITNEYYNLTLAEQG